MSRHTNRVPLRILRIGRSVSAVNISKLPARDSARHRVIHLLVLMSLRGLSERVTAWNRAKVQEWLNAQEGV